MFLIEGLPTLITGFVVLKFLTDSPRDAKWLTPEEREWLMQRLASERANTESVRHFALREVFTHPRLIALAFIYFGIVIGLYGLGLWLPQIVKALGASILQTGFLAALPGLLGVVAIVFWTKRSDATGNRILHLAAPAILGGVALAGSAAVASPFVSYLLLSVAGMCIYVALPCFWPLPTAMLTGSAAAGGIALINALGNLGGFVGPSFVGWLKDATGAFSGGLYGLAVMLILSGLVTLIVGHDRRLEAPASAPTR